MSQGIQYVPSIIKIVIEHDILVILLKLGIKRINIPDLLTGRRIYCIRRVIFPDIFLKERWEDQNFIHAVVSHLQAKVAELIL